MIIICNNVAYMPYHCGTKISTMKKTYDIIIIGGSYSGLSAALALGRSLRQTLVIDAGNPCNSPTPHSHNFLTQDGETPGQISAVAKAQVAKYKTVSFYNNFAIKGTKSSDGFTVTTQDGNSFEAQKLIFATGVKDLLPDIEGFEACWGKSILHCPYCHGYEVKHQTTGIIANGEKAHHYAMLISNWTNDLTIYTNGPSDLTKEQKKQVGRHGISIIEIPIKRLIHRAGQVSQIEFEDESKSDVSAIYSGPDIEQHSQIPQSLGCELNEQGLINVDGFQKTNIPGVYACGDNSTMRSVAMAVSSGSIAGVVANKDLVEEVF